MGWLLAKTLLLVKKNGYVAIALIHLLLAIGKRK